MMGDQRLVWLKKAIPWRENGRMFRLQFWNDVIYFFLNTFLVAQLMVSLNAFIIHGLLKLGPPPLAPYLTHSPSWLQILVACMVFDFITYIGHRLEHSIPLLWRFHSLHHSATKVDFLVTTRLHPVDFLWVALGTSITQYLLGTSFFITCGAYGIFYLYLFFTHSNIKVNLGPLQWVLGTPKFHHWHHDKTPDNSSKNFGFMFPCWDWMFGTLYLPKEERYPSEVGINGPNPETFTSQILYPFLPSKSTQTSCIHDTRNTATDYCDKII